MQNDVRKQIDNILRWKDSLNKNYNVRKPLYEEDSSNLILELNAEEIKLKYYPDINQEMFDKIVGSDKLTSNIKNGKVGKYAKWLLRLYLEKKLKFNDLSRAEQYIEVYDKLLKSNKLKNKDINNYKTLDDIYDVIEEYIDNEKPISNNDKIKKVKDNSKVIMDDGKYLVIEPLTKEASCLYGKGSRWCTSGDDEFNKFGEYNADGSLYIIIDKSKRNELGDVAKYQIHFQDAEYRDDKNNPINFKTNIVIKNVINKLIKKLNITPMELIKMNPTNIRLIDNPSEELQLAVVRKSDWLIKHIENPTERVQLEVVSSDGNLIEYIKNPSKAVIKVALENNPNALNNDEYEDMIRGYKNLLRAGAITQSEYDDMVSSF